MTERAGDSAYDTESAIQHVAGDRWRCQLSPAWNIESNPNGGYAATPVLRAMQEVADGRAPVSVTTHFLRPAVAGQSADIAVRPRRQGRTSAVVSGLLSQDGIERVVCIGAFAELLDDGNSASSSPPPGEPPAPELPPPGKCRDRFGLEQGMAIALDGRVEIRIHPDHAVAGATDRSVVTGWVRFVDERTPDPLALLLFADAFPPSLYASHGFIGWVPTLELTVQVCRRPVDGWIRGRFESSDVVDGRVVEDGVLWDDTGRVVARSRQLAQILARPRR